MLEVLYAGKRMLLWAFGIVVEERQWMLDVTMMRKADRSEEGL